MKEHIDTCIAGNGVVCGQEVNVNPDCSIGVSEGTVVLPDGTVTHIAQKRFRYYVKPDRIHPGVKEFMFSYLKLDKIDEQHMAFLQLADGEVASDSTDALKQQHPDDIPERNLNRDKVMVLLALPGDKGSEQVLFWILVTRNALAGAAGIATPKDEDDQALFSKTFSQKEIDIAEVDRFLRPVLQLPLLTIPRFGYKQLAIIETAKGLQENNLQPPFATINSFSHVFFEYKEIIDDYALVLRDALKVLHDLFGPLLSHKGAANLEQYRKFLALKIKAFYEEGRHLFYIQYVYDWLRDLTIVYNELVEQLNGFRGTCTCHDVQPADRKGLMVMLGPVLGGRTTYQPLIFRDLALVAERDAVIREVRCMHWRMMIMIRSFDLPFLQQDKVLGSGSQAIEERLDSTNYWESLVPPGMLDVFEVLPVKFTPTRGTTSPLGKMAIPYYYPLDSDSIYSVHQYWDYETTVLRRTDTHLSYNAHAGDEDKPTTDIVNDSYSTRPEVLLPLAFNLEPYHWLRPEGHIGKKVTIFEDRKFSLAGVDLWKYLRQYNLCVDVIAIGLPGSDSRLLLEDLQGLEHRPALQQGHTLVLFFAASDEQIELQECRKTVRPEVENGTVVADFVLPYRFTCCPNEDISYYMLMPPYTDA
jgi:hypothetical protein